MFIIIAKWICFSVTFSRISEKLVCHFNMSLQGVNIYEYWRLFSSSQQLHLLKVVSVPIHEVEKLKGNQWGSRFPNAAFFSSSVDKRKNNLARSEYTFVQRLLETSAKLHSEKMQKKSLLRLYLLPRYRPTCRISCYRSRGSTNKHQHYSAASDFWILKTLSHTYFLDR